MQFDPRADKNKYWQVVHAGGVNIRAMPSMSIACPILGSINCGEFIVERGLRETKKGKLWVRHDKGWSLATRKGQHAMRRARNPYADVSIDNLLKKESAADKSSPEAATDSARKAKKKKKKKQKRKDRKESPAKSPSPGIKAAVVEPSIVGGSDIFDLLGGGASAAPAQAPPGPATFDPFAAGATAPRASVQQAVPSKPVSFDPFAQASAGAAGRANAAVTPQTASQQAEFDPFASDSSAVPKIVQPAGASNSIFFSRDGGAAQPAVAKRTEPVTDLLSEAFDGPSASISQPADRKQSQPPSRANSGPVDLWGSGLVNLDDVVGGVTSKPKKKEATIQELQGDIINLDIGGSSAPAPGKPARRGSSSDIFFSPNKVLDPFSRIQPSPMQAPAAPSMPQQQGRGAGFQQQPLAFGGPQTGQYVGGQPTAFPARNAAQAQIGRGPLGFSASVDPFFGNLSSGASTAAPKRQPKREKSSDAFSGLNW